MAEIEKFPSAVLAHHYPDVPNVGDFTKIRGDEFGAIDVLVGGTPCQDFSVAGLRAGMDGKRGQLTIEFARLAGRLRSRWLVWENVPGVLSSDGGRAFGMFLGLLGECGYGVAYRVLDAQYFGVPQRRRRVFVVGHLGDWRRAAAVLFERDCLSGHPAPRREKGQVAPTIPSRSTGGGGLGSDFDCDGGVIEAVCMSTGQASAEIGIGIGIGTTLNCNHEAPIVTHSLRSEGFDASEDGMEKGTPLVCVDTMPTMQSGSDSEAAQLPIADMSYAVRTAQTSANGIGVAEGVAHTLDQAQGQCVAFTQNQAGDVLTGDVIRVLGEDGEVAGSLSAEPGTHQTTYLAFDPTQVTSKTNRSNPQVGDPCDTLAKGAQPPAICIKGAAIGRKPEAGPQYGEILEDDSTYTLNATEQHAVAYGCYDEQTPKVSEDVMPTLRGRRESGGEMQFVAYEPVGFIHPRQLRGSETNNQVGIKPDADISDALTREGPGAVSYHIQDQNTGKSIKEKLSDVATCLGTRDLSKYQGTFNADVIQSVMQVRRLTPEECEKLQGFEPGYTKISAKTADGPRYRALGNSMAVPVMAWIGRRIQMVEEIA